MRVSIISNPTKDKGYALAARAAGVLMRSGADVLAGQSMLAALPEGVLSAADEELVRDVDFIVTLGGDGTILTAARASAGRAPILGVNLGRKGFLTEVELPDLDGLLARAARGEGTIERRMMLSAAVYDDRDVIRGSALALNDMYATGVTSPRLVHVEAKLKSNMTGRYSADGLLVSSPTGSTGYALSAGGPVVTPDVPCMLLTPVCAHTLSAVPFVIPADEVVTIRPIPPTQEIRVNADGEERARLPAGWRVEISRAATDALFLRFGKKDFFELIRDKLVEWYD